MDKTTIGEIADDIDADEEFVIEMARQVMGIDIDNETFDTPEMDEFIEENSTAKELEEGDSDD